MLIAVDIDNSNIWVSIFDLDGLNRENIDLKMEEISPKVGFQISSISDKTADEYSLLIYNILKINKIEVEQIEGGIISSVVPKITPLIYKAIKKLTNAYIYTVGDNVKTGLNITVDSTTQVGADLVVNAVASTALYSYPQAIIDFRTASTITLIDKNKCLCGVIIMPGVMLSLNSLAQNTALLGHISIDKSKNDPIIIGKNTEESIISGVVGNFVFSVNGFIEKIKQLWEIDNLTVVSTGQWSKYIIPHCKDNIIENENLTALGLLKLYIINNKKYKS